MRLSSRYLLALLLLVSSVASAEVVQVEVKRKVAKPGLVVLRVTAPDKTSILWKVEEPRSLDLFATMTNSGESVAVFYLSRKQVVVLCDKASYSTDEGFKRRAIQWIISLDGEPDPVVPDPDDPTPRPIPPGFAGEVCKQARLVGKPAEAARLAIAYQGIVGEVSALSSLTLQQIDQIIARYVSGANLSQSWAPFGAWVRTETQSRATTRQTAIQLLRDIQKGLECAQ